MKSGSFPSASVESVTALIESAWAEQGVCPGNFLSFLAYPMTEKRTHPEGICPFLRKGWDSNPRSVISRTHDFQSCALDQLSHLCVLCPSIESVFSLTAFILYHTRLRLSTLFCKFPDLYFSIRPSLPQSKKICNLVIKVHKNYLQNTLKYGIITIQKPQGKAHTQPGGD